METCKSCGATIKWAVTTKNKRMPIDLEPHPKGNIQLQDQGKWHPPLAVVHSVRAPGIEYYISHFATCPSAAQHKRKPISNPVLR